MVCTFLENIRLRVFSACFASTFSVSHQQYMPLYRGLPRGVKQLAKVFLLLAFASVSTLVSRVPTLLSLGNPADVLVSYGLPAVFGTMRHPNDVLVSMVIPATSEDFVCFVHHILHDIELLSALPSEVIFVVSGVRDPSELPSISLSAKVKIQVLTVMQSQNQAKNRNLGAALACGEYVFFFDIDDVFHPDAFRLIWQTIKKFNTPDGVIYSHGLLKTVKHRNTIPLEPFCFSSTHTCIKQEPHTSEELFRELFEHWVTKDDELPTTMHWCCLNVSHQNLAPGWLLVKRSAFLKHGAYDDSIDTGEDGNFIARMIAHGMQVLYVDIQMGYYNRDHQHPECANSH